MNTDHEFHIMQLSDSLFPSGMFSMSSGFESWSKFHKVNDARNVRDFTIQQIRYQIAPLDCIVLRDAVLAAKNYDIERITQDDNYYYSTKLVKEVRSTSVRSGKQIINCIKGMNIDSESEMFLQKFQDEIKYDKAKGVHITALAIAARCFEIPADSTVRLVLYTFCTGVISSAIRLGVISHLDGQKILFELSDEVERIIPKTRYSTIEDAWQLVPMTEILQMNHEQDDSKMFIT